MKIATSDSPSDAPSSAVETDRRARAERPGVDRRAGGHLARVHEAGDDDAEDDPDPRVVAHPRRPVEVLGGRGRGEDQPTHARPDEGLDRVVDRVDGRDLVEDELGEQQHGADADRPRRLDPREGSRAA